MRTTSLDAEIQRLSEDISLPTDNGDAKKDYLWFSHLITSMTDEAVDELVSPLYHLSKGTRSRYSDLSRHFKHCVLVMLNLSRAALTNRWLLISMTRKEYANNFWLKQIGLSYSHMRDVVNYLHESGNIELLKGKRYKGQPLWTRIFPSQGFKSFLIKAALSTEQPINPPYVFINEAEGNYRSVIQNLSDDHPDKKRLLEVNEYFKEQSWALKGPVRLIYKNNVVSGGRLYTDFQCLRSRNYAIRQNTLINGEPITEVDFNANHLRMNLAIFAGEDAGESPYEDIMELANVRKRSIVKNFITVAMGAKDRDSGIKALYREGFSDMLIKKIEASTLKRYPKLVMFKGFGVNAQSLEGQILLDTMVRAVRLDIPAIPIHDAVAVNTSHAAWSKDVMGEVWQERLNRKNARARPKLSLNTP